jgi:hypothetical protein
MEGQLFELGRWEIGNGKEMEDRKWIFMDDRADSGVRLIGEQGKAQQVTIYGIRMMMEYKGIW